MNSQTSLVVHWLRLCASSAEGVGSIPDWKTNIPYAMHIPYVQKKKKKAKHILKWNTRY